MKAILVYQFGDPSVLQVGDVAEPVPRPEQVVVEVKAVGINPVETYIRSGTYAFKPQLPYTPGADGAGVVASVGTQVDTVKPGDQVWINGVADPQHGTYAQKVLCNVNQVFALPQALSFEQGASVGVPYITAYHALIQVARGIGGETVLVHGATGGVGIACVQIAVARGMTVIGTGGSDEGRELVRREGAQHVLDHTSPGYIEQITAITKGRGVDVVCEMIANVNLVKDLQVLAPRGRIAVIGNRGSIEINPRDLMKSHGAILGVMAGNEAERAEATAAITAGLFNGTLRPIVDHSYPLGEAPKAHEAVMKGGSKGKLVLIP